MTKKEKRLINAWSKLQYDALENAHQSYAYILSKYEDLLSCRIFTPEKLIHKIFICNRVGENQRRADLNAVMNYLNAIGKVEAVESFLGLGIG